MFFVRAGFGFRYWSFGFAIMKSGWWDLNPRPVAAATALPKRIELISASSSLVILLASCCFRPGGEGFAVDEAPQHSMLCGLGIASVMAANTLSQILAKTHVAPSGFLAAQHVTIKHFSTISDSHRAGGI